MCEWAVEGVWTNLTWDLNNREPPRRAHGKSVSVRGCSHTMGGQTIAQGGYVIDTTYFKKMTYNALSNTGN